MIEPHPFLALALQHAAPFGVKETDLRASYGVQKALSEIEDCENHQFAFVDKMFTSIWETKLADYLETAVHNCIYAAATRRRPADLFRKIHSMSFQRAAERARYDSHMRGLLADWKRADARYVNPERRAEQASASFAKRVKKMIIDNERQRK